MSCAVTKAELRKTALAARDRFPVERRIEASLAIAEIGSADIEVSSGEIVSGFWPIRSEVDIRPLLFRLREKGARLCLPVVLDRQTIVFRELLRGARMVETGFGTAGPGEEAAILDPDLMLVPLAAFDRRGNRVGYGAGHYDRAIASLREKGKMPRLIGIALDVQEVSAIPFEIHDVPLPAILTESGMHVLDNDGATA